MGQPSRKFADRLTLVMVGIALVIISLYIAMLTGAVDSDALNAVSAVMVIPTLPLAWLALILQQRDKRVQQRVEAKSGFFVVSCPLWMASLATKVASLATRPAAMVLPLPRIADINLTPRLLQIPRAFMGAAI